VVERATQRLVESLVVFATKTTLCPSRQAVPGGGDFGVAAEKIGSGPGALALRFMLTVPG